MQNLQPGKFASELCYQCLKSWEFHMKVPIGILLKKIVVLNVTGISLFPIIQQYLSLDFGKIKKRVLLTNNSSRKIIQQLR